MKINKCYYKYILLQFILLFLFTSFNQVLAVKPEVLAEASFSGIVKDKNTGEPLIGASIYIKSTKLGTYTNKNGYFNIQNIPEGKYKIIVTYIGYDKIEEDITFKAKKPIKKEFELSQSSVETDEITVEAERESDKREITVSKISIPAKQLQQIRIGGETDVFRSLQYLPGILTSSQISSGLFVRGGSPDQNLVLLDGATVYNPTHIFGFISTFNTDAIKSVDLIKGGFPAEYGGRLSAVLDLTQKDGNTKKIQGIAALGILSSKASLEGPLGNGSWFISGRRTYLELIKQFISEDPASPLPDFNFYDLNAKVTQNITDNDKISVSGFISNDNFQFSGSGTSMEMGMGNKLAAMRWIHTVGNDGFITFNLSASKYNNSMSGDESGYKFVLGNSITDYTIKGSYDWFVSDVLTNKFGFETTKYTFNYLQNFSGNTDSTQTGSSAGQINMTVDDWVHSVYEQVNYKASELVSIQGGIRGNYWKMTNLLTFDPRLSLRYQFQENVAFKAAFGMFHQYLKLAAQPDISIFDTWLPTDSTVPASVAYHYIFSIETHPWEGYDLNFDVYYKKMNNITELNTTTTKAKVVKDLFFIGNAHSYGFEVFLQKKIGKFSGWAGYALGFISDQFDSINYGKSFHPKYDRTHDLKVVLQYEFNETWDFGGSFTFQTGQSYTGATSRYQSFFPDDNSGVGKVIQSDRYGLRLPPSHQLNLNAIYKFKSFGLSSKLIFDIYNVYNRRDIWFRYYNTNEAVTTVQDVRLLPIIPTITYEIKF